MAGKTLRVALATATLCLTFVASAVAANPTALLIPQATAFAVLGHSCGGIQEQAFTTGFDASSGRPTGAVYLQTRCGGSGRGGGYRATTYAAWVSATWDFAGSVVSSARIAGPPTSLDPAFTVTDGSGDTVYNRLSAINVAPANCSVGNTSYCTYRAYLTVPLPGAPTGVTVSPASGQYLVAWTPAAAGAAAVTSSTVTATPVASSAPVVSATASGTGTSVLLGPLVPQTTYAITVAATDAAGTGRASTAVTITTPASAIVPSAPTGVAAQWTAPGLPGDTLVANWLAPTSAGDSPIDAYEVTITDSDAGTTVTQSVGGSSLSASFAVSDVPNWTVQVRAHNAAGWGPWSAAVTLGGA